MPVHESCSCKRSANLTETKVSATAATTSLNSAKQACILPHTSNALHTAFVAAQKELQSCNAAVKSATAMHQKALLDLKVATADCSRAQLAADHAAKVADSIARSEEFEAVSEECDSANGTWASPAFRFRRKCCAAYRAGIPKCESCNKDYPTTSGFSPGLLVAMCPHRYVYYMKLLRRGESPEVVLDFLYDRCRQLCMPRRVCYDNGCNLHSYIAARRPDICSIAQVLIDRLHYRNHVHCSVTYHIDRYVRHIRSLDFNSQAVEQMNKLFKRLAAHLRFCRPDKAIKSLRSFAMVSASLSLQRTGANKNLHSRVHASQQDVFAMDGAPTNDDDSKDHSGMCSDSDSESDDSDSETAAAQTLATLI